MQDGDVFLLVAVDDTGRQEAAFSWESDDNVASARYNMLSRHDELRRNREAGAMPGMRRGDLDVKTRALYCLDADGSQCKDSQGRGVNARVAHGIGRNARSVATALRPGMWSQGGEQHQKRYCEEGSMPSS